VFDGISKGQILEIVEGTLTPEQIERSFIYWNSRISKKREEIRAGPQIITMPFEGTIVFVDLAPRANWAHPCLYILVDNKTLKTKVIESSFPPIMDRPSENYIVLLRFGNMPSDEHDFKIFGGKIPSNDNKSLHRR
jgi:hypothetical protein